MGRSAFRGMVSCVLTVLFPFSLFAADSNAAMLYTSGPAWVNGAHVPRVRLRQFSPVIFCKPAPILLPTSINLAPRSESYPIPWFSLKETQSKLIMAGLRFPPPKEWQLQPATSK